MESRNLSPVLLLSPSSSFFSPPVFVDLFFFPIHENPCSPNVLRLLHVQCCDSLNHYNLGAGQGSVREDRVVEALISTSACHLPPFGLRLLCPLEVFVGLTVYFIEHFHPDKLFWRGQFYGERDDFIHFSYFSRAALELLLQGGKKSDIIYYHDWRLAFVVR